MQDSKANIMKKRFLAFLLSVTVALSSNAVAVFADEMEETYDCEVATSEPIEIIDKSADGGSLVSDAKNDASSAEDAILNGYAGTGVGTHYRTQSEVEAYINNHPAKKSDVVSYKKKPVTSGTYSAGELSGTTLESSLNMLNRVRYIAGLNPVTLNEGYNYLAQTGMLADAINKKLSHTPAKPSGMSEQMYTDAYEGCSNSNIMWSSSSDFTLNQAIISGWTGDSDSSNIARLGHRRWVLDPRMMQTGFGSVVGGNGRYSAMYATDGAYRYNDPNADKSLGVAWPARTMPTGYFSASDAWSFSIGKYVEKNDVSVTLKRVKDKKTWKFPDSSKSSKSSNYYFNVDNGGYGLTGCVIFRPDGISSYSAGDEYEVNITYAGGSPISYTVTFFKPGSVVDHGQVGNYLWTFYEDGQLVFEGNGDFECPNTPWDAYASKITKVVIPDGMTSFDGNALVKCTKLKKIVISKDHKYMLLEDGILYNPDKTALFSITPLYKDDYVIIEEKVNYIGANAFASNYKISLYGYTEYARKYAETHGLSFAFIEKDTVMNPVISLYDNGNYTDGETVSAGSDAYISTYTGSANIYYTLDGSTPVIPELKSDNTYASPTEPTRLYEDRILLTEDILDKSSAVPGQTLGKVTIKAIGVRPSFISSGCVSKTITVLDDSLDFGDIFEEDREGFSDARDVKNELWITGVHDSVYDGKAVTFPEMRVYYYKTRLRLNKDYTVKYKKNNVAGTATVTVKGKGNYSGSVSRQFTIAPLDIISANAIDIVKAYNGLVQKGKPSLTYMLNGKEVKLLANVDYKLEYPNAGSAFCEVGDYQIIVKGIGNFAGTKTVTETISDKPLVNSAVVEKIADQDYTGSEVRPKPQVVLSGKTLTEDIDYILTYDNNTDAGKGKVIIRGIGSYSGIKKVPFNIKGTDIKSTTIECGKVTYTGKPVVPEISIKDTLSGRTLSEGTDYIVISSNNISAGKSAKLFIKGKGPYSGSVTKKFTISPYDVGGCDIAYDGTTVYKKGGAKPELTVSANVLGKERRLIKGIDYSVSYVHNNAASGSATLVISGKGNYGGTIEKSFSIDKASLDKMTVTVSDVKYKKQPGIYKSKVKLTDTDGKKLVAGVDYKKAVTYTYARGTFVKYNDKTGKQRSSYRPAGVKVKDTDILPAGTEIKVTVDSVENGNYTGTNYTVFRVIKSDIASATVKVKSQTFTGRALRPLKDNITVKIGNTTLSKMDYDVVSYSSNTSKGTAKIVIAGKGIYGGRKAGTFVIKAKSIK